MTVPVSPFISTISQILNGLKARITIPLAKCPRVPESAPPSAKPAAAKSATKLVVCTHSIPTVATITNILSATLRIFTTNLFTVASKSALSKYLSKAFQIIFAILNPIKSTRRAQINLGIKLTPKAKSMS